MEIRDIEQLVQLIKGAKVSEITLIENGRTVSIKKPLHHTLVATKPEVRQAEPAPSEHSEKPSEQGKHAEFIITAPMVGIFHSVETITSPGVTVSQGQTVGAIESMKLMNDVVSDVSGVITEILIEDGMPVEYGQPLFRVSPLESGE